MATTRPRKVTAAEFFWQARQPVLGLPSLPRLRAALRKAGFSRVRLKLAADQESLQFTLRPGPEREGLKGDRLLRLLIRIFRSAGFAVGFEELGVDSCDAIVKGSTLTGPLEAIAGNGAPRIQGVKHGRG